MPSDELAVEDFADLCDLAREFNEYVPPERTRYAAAAPSDAKGDRPGDHFNRRAGWADILGPHGWAVAWTSGEVTYWTRPGKARGCSATTGKCTGDLGGDLLYVFSTNAAPLEGDTGYSKFAALAYLEFGGDFGEAAKHLRANGYGEPEARINFSSPPRGEEPKPIPPAPPEAKGAPPRIFRWSSELRKQAANDKWVWHGYLSRGGVTLLSALWKAGKTTLLSYLLREMKAGGVFLGQEVRPARVLFVSEEAEDLWAERCEALGLADYIGWIPRPFTGKPNPQQWQDFLTALKGEVERHQFDVVVFDTLAKLWPVRDENDAPAVDAALMPIWPLTERAAVLLVHHLRKSDGGEATGSRGSGALPAFVETIVELRRYNASDRKCTKRVLSGYGRYKETPDEVVVELTPDGYVAHGERAEVRGDEIARTITDILKQYPDGLTIDNILEYWPDGAEPPRRQTFLFALREGVKKKLWHERGRGVRGDPYLFSPAGRGGAV